MPARVILANAFSLSMLEKTPAVIAVQEVTVEQVRKLLEVAGSFESAIGHESTAKLLSELLGVEVPAKRQQITLTPETLLIVFQLMTRLPEGKVLTREELEQLLRQGKARLYIVYLAEPWCIVDTDTMQPHTYTIPKSREVEEQLQKAGKRTEV